MPTYEYVCGSCGRHVEAVQRFTDPPLTECPHCGGPLKRVFHPVGIVLKGSGFYSTDNRSGRKTPAKKEGDAATSSSPATESSTSSSDSSSSSSSSSSAKPSAEPVSKPAPKTDKKKDTNK